MLEHLSQHAVAARIQNALLCALEDGRHTRDIAGPHTREVLGTRAFADAADAEARVRPARKPSTPAQPAHIDKQLVGTDVFFEWTDAERDPDMLAAIL